MRSQSLNETPATACIRWWQDVNAAGTVTSGYYLYDAQGNLAQTVSGAGVVTPVAAYTAWGEVVPRADGTKPTLGSLGYGAKFGYWRDSESGLYLCTLRFYDAANGRFVTRDPIGFDGGSNLFGYTGNDPGNASDPLGLKAPSRMSCLELLNDIRRTVGVIHQRIQEQKDNKNDLFYYKMNPDPVTGARNPNNPGAGTWDTHDGEINKYIKHLKELEKFYDINKCWDKFRDDHQYKKFPYNPYKLRSWVDAKAPTAPSGKGMDRFIVRVFTNKARLDAEHQVITGPSTGGLGMQAGAGYANAPDSSAGTIGGLAGAH